MKLEHMALYTIIKNVKYDGSNNVIENALFEIDQIIPKLEEELEEHINQEPQMPVYINDYTSYTYICNLLSKLVFDNFNYNEHITTCEHVEWKEYFQTMYHYVVMNDIDEYTFLPCTLNYYDILPVPKMVDEKDDNYHIIMRINNLFLSLKEEHSILSKEISIESYHDRYKQYGMKQLEWYDNKRYMEDILKKYTEIIQWSLH